MMRTIKINESQINEISEGTKLTEYKFYNNVQRFLSDLLKDPVGAKVPFLLQANGITRNQLLYHLKSRDIIKRFQKISDKDSEGNPKTAKMIIRYSVPKKNFAKKMKKLYIDMVAKNVPDNDRKKVNEWSQLEDDLKLMNGSPLTMGVIGHPEYRQTDEYAKIKNDEIVKKKKKEMDECDGGASAGTTNCQSSGAFVQPMFGVQRRKMPTELEEDTTASSVTQNGDISMGVSVPFGVDKETADRTPGFSVERQDEKKKRTCRNSEGGIVPNVCPSCGGDVALTLKGEPVFLCGKCGKYFGALPFKKHFINENEIEESLLSEENSINGELDKEASEVFNFVINYKYSPNEIVHRDEEKTIYEISFKRTFMECVIDYCIQYFVFNDGEHHEMNCYSIPMSNKFASIHIDYDRERGFLSLGELHDSIQHELTHVFKGIKGFENDMKYGSKTLYVANAANYFYCSKNKYMKAIGCVFYMGMNDEQDAYINGMYAAIKENLPKGVSPDEIVRRSQLYDKVIELIDIRDNIDAYFSNSEFIEALKMFKKASKYKNGLTKETFLKKINYTLARIKEKYLNMIKAYQKYITRSGMMVRGDVISVLAKSFAF